MESYKKEMTDLIGGYVISYWHNGVRQKAVNETKPAYVAWLAVPNTPDVVAFVPPTPPTALTFEENKVIRLKQVDGKTFELLELGVEYPVGSGKNFGLLQDKLVYYSGMERMASKGLISYPFPVRYLDETKYDLVGSVDMDNFYTTLSGRVAILEIQGGSIKDSLRSSLNQSELDTIIDNRV